MRTCKVCPRHSAEGDEHKERKERGGGSDRPLCAPCTAHHRPILCRRQTDRANQPGHGNGYRGEMPQEVNVPFRDNDDDGLPELDYEVTEGKNNTGKAKKDDYTPAWRKKK